MTDPHTAAVRLLELSGKALDAPWNTGINGDDEPEGRCYFLGAENLLFARVPRDMHPKFEASVRLIAAARNDLPAICEALLRMEAALQRLLNWRERDRMSQHDYKCFVEDTARAALSPRTPQAASVVAWLRAKADLQPGTTYKSETGTRLVEAADLIESLTAQLARAEAERDAAVFHHGNCIIELSEALAAKDEAERKLREAEEQLSALAKAQERGRIDSGWRSGSST